MKAISISAACILITLSGPASAAQPAPWGALVAPEKALEVVVDQVCLPAMLERTAVEPLARGRHMIEGKAKRGAPSTGDRVWKLASLGDVHVALWADGTCSSAVEFGDPDKLEQLVLAAAKAKGLVLTPGLSGPAADGGVRQAWCSAERPPFVIAIIKKTKGGRRPAIVTTAFWAKGDYPDFCNPAPAAP